MISIIDGDDGLIHIPGAKFNTFETACGKCDTKTYYTESTLLPTCIGCLYAANELFRCITKRN